MLIWQVILEQAFTAECLLETFAQVRKKMATGSVTQEANIYPVMIPVWLLYLLQPLLSADISDWDQMPLTQSCRMLLC